MVFAEFLQVQGPVILDAVKDRMIDILRAPFFHIDMFWIIIPILISLFMMEYYFGKHKDEELGWNTAFANSLVLVFVSVDLLRKLDGEGILLHADLKNALVIALISVGFLLTLMDLYHLLPKDFAFGLSAKLPVSMLSVFCVLMIYSELPFDYVTLLAVLAYSIILGVVLKIIQLTETTEGEEENAT